MLAKVYSILNHRSPIRFETSFTDALAVVVTRLNPVIRRARRVIPRYFVSLLPVASPFSSANSARRADI